MGAAKPPPNFFLYCTAWRSHAVQYNRINDQAKIVSLTERSWRHFSYARRANSQRVEKTRQKVSRQTPLSHKLLEIEPATRMTWAFPCRRQWRTGLVQRLSTLPLPPPLSGEGVNTSGCVVRSPPRPHHTANNNFPSPARERGGRGVRADIARALQWRKTFLTKY